MLLRIAGMGLAGLALVTATAALTGAAVAGVAACACLARRRTKAHKAWPEDEAAAPPPTAAET